MKKTLPKIFLPAFLLAALSLFSFNGIAQTRKLPDGSIVYPDGSKKLPNGTVINKKGTVTRRNNEVLLPGKRVVYRNGRNVNERRVYRRRHNERRLPPGQAKKIYGGSARDYAPGQQKKWEKNRNKGNRNYREDYDDHQGHRGKHGGENHKDKDD